MSRVLRKAWKSTLLKKEPVLFVKLFIHDSSFQLATVPLTGISVTIQVWLVLPVDLKGTSLKASSDLQNSRLPNWPMVTTEGRYVHRDLDNNFNSCLTLEILWKVSITGTFTLTFPHHSSFHIVKKQNWKIFFCWKVWTHTILPVSGGETAETTEAVRKVQINYFPTETHICQVISGQTHSVWNKTRALIWKYEHWMRWLPAEGS